MRARRTSKAAAVVALIACFLLPTEARSDPGRVRVNPFAVGFDVVLLRPCGLVATLIGAGFFVPAAVVTAPGGWDSIEEAWEIFVSVPAEWTFERPLGDF